MSLPKIDLPLFPVTIPSTGKETSFRPFTVKEEKILLTAQESKDMDQIILAVKQIVQACVTDVDLDKLATFDYDYLLIQIRAQSVSNVMEFKITDPETEKQIEMEIDVSDVELFIPEGHEKMISVGNDTTLVMRYPRIESFYKSLTQKSQIEQFRFMVDCVESVVVGDEVYKFENYSEEEVMEFFDGLTGSAIEKIGKFFDTMPRLRLTYEYEIDGKPKVFVIQGMETFFQSR